MANNKLILALFAAMVLIQLAVPMKMIMDSESIIAKGAEYKIRTVPYDPIDPFRGNYVQLSFEISTYPKSETELDSSYTDPVFVLLKRDRKGFGVIRDVIKDRPTDNQDYIEAEIRNLRWLNDSSSLNIKYPFERFYMHEEKAPIAERIYMKASRDSLKETYALISIHDGEVVLRDVLINDTSIVQLAEIEMMKADTLVK